jgi:hypothetical protein
MWSHKWTLATAFLSTGIVLSVASYVSALNCTQGCSTTDAGACEGSTTGGSCPCVALGNCGGSQTYYSGTVTHGSVTGSTPVTFGAIPCRYTRNCNNATTVLGVCSTFWGVCQTDGGCGCAGCCQPCKWGCSFVSATYSQCTAGTCNEGG